MRSTLLAGLHDPNRAFVVLLAGLVLVYRECLAPGRVLPGVAGAIFAISAGYALFQHPWSGLGAAVLATGFALILLQAFGTWFWIPAILGTASLMFGAVHIVISPSIRPAYAALAIPFSFISVLLMRAAVQARRNKRSVQ